MKKLKSSRPRDRLSELPESLIFHIFWLLPMRDVVRTTILSKHWNNLWTTTPFLNFSFYNDMDIVQVRNFINRALILWEGMKIQKFKIDLRCMNDESFFSDFDVWVYSALRKEVQELYLQNPCDYDEAYLVPQYLYSCSSLKVLYLVDCRLEINGNVQWNHLQNLTITVAFMSEDDINQVLSGSSLLEVFILTLLDASENLSIQSSSLKRLSIHSCVTRELRIWTPNLETLEISGTPYSKCLLMDVSSLTHAMLCFDRFYIPLEETLRQVFPSIQHVERVTISDNCIKVLGDLIKKGLLPSSSNAKFLKLENRSAKFEQIVGVLEIFPKLKMLVLDMRSGHYQHVQESLKFDANLPKSFLMNLRTIYITTREGDNLVFPFMKIVLENASKLEKMVIRVVLSSRRSNYLFLMSQKLMRMQRSFPAAELILRESDLHCTCCPFAARQKLDQLGEVLPNGTKSVNVATKNK